MFSRMRTSAYMGNCSETDKLAEWIDSADTILVGAGAGMSTAAGLEYTGRRFTQAFPDFISRYGYRSMYAATFQRYGSEEEYWAYWSRHVLMNRYDFEENGTYADLLSLLDGKDYFVITTNVDSLFVKSGFDPDRLFCTQGDYGLWQCAKPCCQKTFPNESVIREMVAQQKDMRVPTELMPRCPECGGPVAPNLRCDDTFVQDENWYRMAERYQAFARSTFGKDALYLELGVGYNTPGIIKYPFWEMARANRGSRYACINMGEIYGPPGCESRSLVIDRDIKEVLEEIRSRRAPCTPCPRIPWRSARARGSSRGR